MNLKYISTSKSKTKDKTSSLACSSNSGSPFEHRSCMLFCISAYFQWRETGVLFWAYTYLYVTSFEIFQLKNYLVLYICTQIWISLVKLLKGYHGKHIAQRNSYNPCQSQRIVTINLNSDFIRRFSKDKLN